MTEENTFNPLAQPDVATNQSTGDSVPNTTVVDKPNDDTAQDTRDFGAELEAIHASIDKLTDEVQRLSQADREEGMRWRPPTDAPEEAAQFESATGHNDEPADAGDGA